MEYQPSMDDEFLRKIHQRIEDNLDNELFSVEDLANSAALSRSMLHRKLIKLTGKSARDLITEKRLTKAKELIASQARLFGNTFYNSSMAPSYMHAMDGTYVSNMQSLNAMSLSINSLMSMLNSVEARTISAQIQAFRAQLMAYPFIKDEIENISKFENENRVLRLVNKDIDGQKFIALEMLELQNGTVKVQILSPFQFKSYYSTMYLEPATTLALNGYVPVVNLKDHVLRTTIDLEKNLLFRFGPGMDTDSYIFYDPEEKIYTRGKLICIPLNFRVEKKYL